LQPVDAKTTAQEDRCHTESFAVGAHPRQDQTQPDVGRAERKEEQQQEQEEKQERMRIEKENIALSRRRLDPIRS